VIPLLIYAHRQKIPDFLRVGGGGIEKGRLFVIFGVGVLSVGYSLHRHICTQKAWIISGDVVDVPFGVSNPHK